MVRKESIISLKNVGYKCLLTYYFYNFQENCLFDLALEGLTSQPLMNENDFEKDTISIMSIKFT